MTTPDVLQVEALIARYPYLANMQDLCDDLRRTAPQHTYANDAELLVSSKSCLDLNMQIPSTDLPGILTTLQRVYGVLGAQQRIMELLFADPRELSLSNAALRERAEKLQNFVFESGVVAGNVFKERNALRARLAECEKVLKEIAANDHLTAPHPIGASMGAGCDQGLKWNADIAKAALTAGKGEG